MHEYWMKTDVNKLPDVKDSGLVFSQDSEANLIGVEVYDGNTPVELTGDITANVVRANGTTIEIDGDSEDNRAWVVLDEDAYAVVGNIGVFIKLASGTMVTTLGGVEAYVYKSR